MTRAGQWLDVTSRWECAGGSADEMVTDDSGFGIEYDPLAVVSPGDPDHFSGRAGACGFQSWDHFADPGRDPPWQCPRDPEHLGLHIATDPGYRVSAVHP
jgi:hypothetical protein